MKKKNLFHQKYKVYKMVREKNLLLSVDYKSESTKSRLPYDIKRYATEGEHIPLKKNWSETWCTLPIQFNKILDEMLNLKLRNDDVFLVTFMKSGTTWMQECAWLLLNNLDFEKAKKAAVMRRSPFLEFRSFSSGAPSPVEVCKLFDSPRLLKTHLPANLVPLEIWVKRQKIIYVARNVKDVIVSSFHFTKGLNLWCGNSLSEYVEDFLNNEIVYTHYWSHVVDFWKMRHESFIFFVTYEEMQRDLANVLQRVCTFLERPQLSNEQLEKAMEYLSFENMKTNKIINLTNLLREELPIVSEDFEFMRRGIVGAFKDELTPELINKIDKWSSDFLRQHGIEEQDIFGKL